MTVSLQGFQASTVSHGLGGLGRPGPGYCDRTTVAPDPDRTATAASPKSRAVTARGGSHAESNELSESE
eukprot:760679-Hanusia_phi.AAC.7